VNVLFVVKDIDDDNLAALSINLPGNNGITAVTANPFIDYELPVLNSNNLSAAITTTLNNDWYTLNSELKNWVRVFGNMNDYNAAMSILIESVKRYEYSPMAMNRRIANGTTVSEIETIFHRRTVAQIPGDTNVRSDYMTFSTSEWNGGSAPDANFENLALVYQPNSTPNGVGDRFLLAFNQDSNRISNERRHWITTTPYGTYGVPVGLTADPAPKSFNKVAVDSGLDWKVGGRATFSILRQDVVREYMMHKGLYRIDNEPPAVLPSTPDQLVTCLEECSTYRAILYDIICQSQGFTFAMQNHQAGNYDVTIPTTDISLTQTNARNMFRNRIGRLRNTLFTSRSSEEVCALSINSTVSFMDLNATILIGDFIDYRCGTNPSISTGKALSGQEIDAIPWHRISWPTMHNFINGIPNEPTVSGVPFTPYTSYSLWNYQSNENLLIDLSTKDNSELTPIELLERSKITMAYSVATNDIRPVLGYFDISSGNRFSALWLPWINTNIANYLQRLAATTLGRTLIENWTDQPAGLIFSRNIFVRGGSPLKMALFEGRTLLNSIHSTLLKTYYNDINALSYIRPENYVQGIQNLSMDQDMTESDIFSM
jgi:hypothetical protein